VGVPDPGISIKQRCALFSSAMPRFASGPCRQVFQAPRVDRELSSLKVER